MLSVQLLTTAWPPPAWSTRQTWWCPSTTWTTSSTRMRMIWRSVEILVYTAINILFLDCVWGGGGFTFTCVPEQCLASADNFALLLLKDDAVCDIYEPFSYEKYQERIKSNIHWADFIRCLTSFSLPCFPALLQPGSRRPVNGTDEKFGSKEPKPSTLDPVSCSTSLSIFLHRCLSRSVSPPNTNITCLFKLQTDKFTPGVNHTCEALWNLRIIHWRFARSHLKCKHGIPLA